MLSILFTADRHTARAMSQTNVKVVRAALDAYNRGDLEAILKYAALGCELDWSRSIGPQRGTYTVDQLPQFNLAESLNPFGSRRRTSSLMKSTWSRR